MAVGSSTTLLGLHNNGNNNNDETSPLLLLLTGVAATEKGASSSTCPPTHQQHRRRPTLPVSSYRSRRGGLQVLTITILLIGAVLLAASFLQLRSGGLSCCRISRTNPFPAQRSDRHASPPYRHSDGTPSSSSADGATAAMIPHHQVPTNIPGYPSYRSYQSGGSYHVSYDGRSIMLDGERAIFIGGSLHPVRATRFTWEAALDQAVRQGLNLVTIYVMWSAHQRFADSAYDWSFFSSPNNNEDRSRTMSAWTLAAAIQAAADRGLFVHIRVGPYVCAEYSYGGIPEWVALNNISMAMRRANIPWMDAMEMYLRNVIGYLQDHALFAYQGGNIILAQIENELGEDDDLTPERKDLWAWIDDQGRFFAGEDDDDGNEASVADGPTRTRRRATLQDYADWCGRVAQALAPHVVWTMCNGLSADTTIETYNGFLDADSTAWLDDHGDNGRVQLDQPALWSEDEGGFQIWGDQPDRPSEYVWGVSARSMAYTALRWWARGGAHLNFYMWWGGYNRGRSAAGGIANVYALESPLCPAGEPRQPKFAHLQRLIAAIVAVAPVLLQAPSALDHPERPDVRQEDGTWMPTNHTLAFRYRSDDQDVMFVENTSGAAQQVRIISRNAITLLTLQSFAAQLVVNGEVVFDSAWIDVDSTPLERTVTEIPSAILHRHSWSEVLCIADIATENALRHANLPVEQTSLNMKEKVWSDYARYHVNFLIENDVVADAFIHFDSVEAMAFTVHVDGIHVGCVDTHKHSEGPVVYSVSVPASLMQRGEHDLVIMSESLGYANIVGRWGSGTTAKTKGLTGNVVLLLPLHSNATSIANLTDGTGLWTSIPGLSFDPSLSHHLVRQPVLSQHHDDTNECDIVVQIGGWTEFQFLTPSYDPALEKLYIDIREGRGHFWLNGYDLGRYWNITEDEDERRLFQTYYHLPHDLLRPLGEDRNRLVLFDGLNFGTRVPTTVRLVSSYVGPSNDGSSIFPDQVGFDDACLRR